MHRLYLRPLVALISIAILVTFSAPGFAMASCGGGGGGGGLSISPTKWFVDYSIGPKTKAFLVKNTGASTISDLEIWASPYWNIYYKGCGKTLSSGSTCEVRVEVLSELSTSTLNARSFEKGAEAFAELISVP